MLVLAIAGLIFLMVFVALPALQRSQRDTARRNDLSRVDTSLTQYQTNNQNTGNGDLPEASSLWTGVEDLSSNCSTSACKFVQRYMNSGTDSTTNTFKDPDGTFYNLRIMDDVDTANDAVPTGNMDHTIYIVTGAKCKGEQVEQDTPRHYAVLYRLEGAGIYCIDDQ
ncbi:hypothetical protein IIY24_01015 [Candidatus Saccharibacteria bacterium]|nr:hypothetical protein [Candidatus Saccharibacteria bacterium]